MIGSYKFEISEFRFQIRLAVPWAARRLDTSKEEIHELTAGRSRYESGLGVSIFTLGGLAGAVFYLPFKKVKEWAWESYWMIYAIAGLVVVPLVLALTTSPNAFTVLRSTRHERTCYCFVCGAMWGIGGMTWG